jgi:hypothetical protein
VTLRSVLIGVACAVFLCGIFYFNDGIVRQPSMFRTFLPVSVFGALMVFVILLNPLLHRVGMALSGREMAVVMAMMLTACFVPGFGLLRTVGPFLMYPHYYAKTEPGWSEAGVVDAIPEYMLADPNVKDALNGFHTGLGEGDAHIPLSRVPWRAWARTVAFWFPVIMTLAALCIAIAVVVHRQWSEHEHLPYPIAAFTHSILPGRDGAASPLLRNRLFWIGFAVPALVHANNYAAGWFPDELMQIPLKLDFTPLRTLFPNLWAGHGWPMFSPRIIFTAIGFSFFLASDVSFSLGLAPFLYCTTIGLVVSYGFPVKDAAYISQGIDGYAHAGAFLGVFLALAYSGRQHYLSAVKRAFFLPARDEMTTAEIWGVRVAVVAFALLVLQLASTGLDLQLAFVYVCISAVILTVLSRIVAETGAFYVFTMVYPCALLLGFMGAHAMGFTTMALLYTITSVLLLMPSEALMPFVVQGNKLVSLSGGKIGRTAVVLLVVVGVGFAVAFPMQLYWQYDKGAMATGHWWTTRYAPKLGFNEAVRVRQELAAQGRLEEAEAMSGWKRFAHMAPNGTRVGVFGLVLALALFFAWARMRWTRWPLHPVMFLMLGTWPSRALAPAFLMGWAIKLAVTRYGGAPAYRKVKPLMTGLIAGEMLMGVVFMIIGAVYYFATGRPPVEYGVIPI